ncbi:MAG: ankyrin repeat domain-containing protein [bacterium]|nr:ankyrin repeat domain-containing protein [bacterium]
MKDLHRDSDGIDEVDEAFLRGDFEAVKSLLKSGRVGRDAMLPALVKAIEAKSPELVAAAISLGKLDPNLQGEPYTFLHYAMENSSHEVVAMLCEQGADPNLPINTDGWRALHMAVEVESWKYLEGEQGGYDVPLTKALLEAGADPLLADKNGSTAIDWARARWHRNAVHLMEKAVPASPKPTIGDLRTAGTVVGEGTSTDPAAVAIVNCRSVDDGTPLALSLDKAEQLILRPLGSTAEEAWFLLPNLSSGAERPGYSLLNRARGLALVQPNLTDEVMTGETPRLTLGSPSKPLGSKRFLWLLRPLESSGEQQWAIEDHRGAYSMVAFAHKLADRAPVSTWAWVGESDQRWLIRGLHLPGRN